MHASMYQTTPPPKEQDKHEISLLSSRSKPAFSMCLPLWYVDHRDAGYIYIYIFPIDGLLPSKRCFSVVISNKNGPPTTVCGSTFSLVCGWALLCYADFSRTNNKCCLPSPSITKEEGSLLQL
jgi:hypothetical protein